MEYTQKTLMLEKILYGASNVSAGVLVFASNTRTPAVLMLENTLMFNEFLTIAEAFTAF